MGFIILLGKVILNSLPVMSTAAGIGLLVQKLDDTWKLHLSRREKRYLPLLIVFNGMAIAGLKLSGAESMLLSVFGGSLLFACITDVRFYQVYQITWWIGGAAGAVLLFLQVCTASGEICLLPLVLYGVIQESFFCKMYGRADCHGFLACAVVECAFGGTWKEYLIQMLIAIVLLAVVQLFHKNISRGKLIIPVPFLPYITLSFWTVMYLTKLSQ